MGGGGGVCPGSGSTFRAVPSTSLHAGVGSADWSTPGTNSHFLAAQSYRMPLGGGPTTEPIESGPLRLGRSVELQSGRCLSTSQEVA